MAAGYLDLLQRELRGSVVHPFDSVAELLVEPGLDGQIASIAGGFYVFSDGTWRRVLDDRDLALINVGLDNAATMRMMIIPANSGALGVFVLQHDFEGQPIVGVAGPSGEVVDVAVVHGAVRGYCEIRWSGVLPTPAVVTCVGRPLSRVP